MFGFLRHIVHAVVVAVTASAAATSGIAHPAGTNVSAGMQAGPVCVTSMAQPGTSYTENVNVVNSGNGWENLHLSVQQIGPPAGPPYPAGGHPLPASWVSFTGPGWTQAQHGVTGQVTINIPGDAAKGRYGASLVVTAYGSASGPGSHAAFGAGAATWLEVSVGVSAPPRAFCTGQRTTYWPWTPVNWCKPGLPVNRADPCMPKPLHPPVASAKNCHMTAAAWAQYMNQLRLGGEHYGGGPRAYLRDAHCYVHGHLFNTLAYYRSQHAYRNA